MTIREGRWLCRYCGSENLGRFEECNGLEKQNGCGAAREKGVEFYLPENSPIVTDPELLSDAESGQDWNCDHCGGANKHSYNHHRVLSCVHCGQGRDEGDTVHPKQSFSLGAEPKSAGEAELPRVLPRNSTSHQAPTRTFSDKVVVNKKNIRNVTLASSLMALVGFIIWYLFFATFTSQAQAVGFSWERTVTVESYQTVTEEDWNIPAQGRKVASERRIRDYRQVLDHYEVRTRQRSENVVTGHEQYKCGTENMGNGYFRDVMCSRPVYTVRNYNETYQEPIYRKEPIYDVWYTYQIEKWVFDRKPRATGSDKTPYWPKYLLAANEKKVTQTEAYVVHLVEENGRNQQIKLPLTDWHAVTNGQSFKLTKNRVGMVIAFQ